jgi:hypothetical protein
VKREGEPVLIPGDFADSSTDPLTRLTPLAVGSTSTPSSINLLASHFHAAAGAPNRPLPLHL